MLAKIGGAAKFEKGTTVTVPSYAHLCGAGGADEFGKDAAGLVGGERGGDDEIVMGGLAAVETDGGDFVFERGFVRQVRMDAK